MKRIIHCFQSMRVLYQFKLYKVGCTGTKSTDFNTLMDFCRVFVHLLRIRAGKCH